VSRRQSRLERLPFLGVLIAIFGVGMAGLLMLNTTLQNQTFQGRALTREATELAHIQADLESQLDAAAAPAEVARRASALGLRPNPHPVFLVLPTGKIVGEPAPVSGREVPSLVVKTPAELAAQRAKAAARRAEKAKRKAAEVARETAELQAQARAAAVRRATGQNLPAPRRPAAAPPAPTPPTQER